MRKVLILDICVIRSFRKSTAFSMVICEPLLLCNQTLPCFMLQSLNIKHLWSISVLMYTEATTSQKPRKSSMFCGNLLLNYRNMYIWSTECRLLRCVILIYLIRWVPGVLVSLFFIAAEPFLCAACWHVNYPLFIDAGSVLVCKIYIVGNMAQWAVTLQEFAGSLRALWKKEYVTPKLSITGF